MFPFAKYKGNMETKDDINDINSEPFDSTPDDRAIYVLETCGKARTYGRTDATPGYQKTAVSHA